MRARRFWVNACCVAAAILLAAACADEDVAATDTAAPGDTSGTQDVVATVDATADVAPPVGKEVDISYANEWSDADAPAHAGELITVEGVATVTSGVIVSGRFLKFHVQDETGGVAVFADTQATVESDGYDGSVFAEIFVRRGDAVQVTGTVDAHEGLVELRPTAAGAVAVLSHGNAVPAARVFDDTAALYAVAREAIGALVCVKDVTLAADAAWPADPGEKQKGVRFVAGEKEILADVYPASGIPGSLAPEGAIELCGVCRVSGDTLQVFPRSRADVAPTANDLTGSVTLTRTDNPAWQVAVDVAAAPAFHYDGRTAVLLSDLLPGADVPRPQDFRYKTVARDGRQPFEVVDQVGVRQGMFVQTVDRDGLPVADSLSSRFYASLELSPIHFLDDVSELRLFPADATGPVTGEGSCDEGLNVWIQTDVYHLSFDGLQTQPKVLAEQMFDAVPMTDILSDAILGRYSFDGFLVPDDVRALYDFELAPVNGDSAQIDSELLESAWYVPATGDVYFDLPAPFPAAPLVSDALCHVRALRRFLVARDGTEQTVYLRDLATQTETIDTPDGEGDAVSLTAIVEEAGVLAGDAAGGFDYQLIPSDYPGGVRFPWGHGHLSRLYWWDEGLKTVSTDTAGDLLDDVGTASFGGVADSGWSSVKALLRIELLPSPDPENAAIARGGLELTDPASCNGCHAKRGDVIIPVSCDQCHH